MIAPIFVANSLILRSVRYDITTSHKAHRRILNVSEFSYGVYECKDEFERASMICKFLFLEPNGFYISSLSYGQMREKLGFITIVL